MFDTLYLKSESFSIYFLCLNAKVRELDQKLYAYKLL